MAESDKEILKEQERKQREEIKNIADTMKQREGYNSSNTIYEMKENSVGTPSLFIRGKIDKENVPFGWRYEASWLLNSSYPQEGLVKKIDGKDVFIPIVYEEDKSTVAVYQTPNDVVNAILSVNSLDRGQVNIDTVSGIIEIIGYLHDNLTMPAGLKNEDGKIKTINDYGKEYVIKQSNAHEASYTGVQSGSNESNTENIKQSPYYEDSTLSKYKDSETEKAVFGPDDFNYSEMKRVYAAYKEDSTGEVVSNVGKDGSDRVINGGRESQNPRVASTLALAKIWVSSYNEYKSHMASEKGDFSPQFTSDEIQRVFNSLTDSWRGKKLSEIVDNMHGCELSRDLIECMIYFISNQKVSETLGLQRDMSADLLINHLNTRENEDLMNGANVVRQMIFNGNNSNNS